MGPKVEAVCDFVLSTGGTAAIGALKNCPTSLLSRPARRFGSLPTPQAYVGNPSISGRLDRPHHGRQLASEGATVVFFGPHGEPRELGQGAVDRDIKGEVDDAICTR